MFQRSFRSCFVKSSQNMRVITLPKRNFQYQTYNRRLTVRQRLYLYLSELFLITRCRTIFRVKGNCVEMRKQKTILEN